MSGKHKKLLFILCFINFIFFIYYLLLSDINPAGDTFYYMSIADSLHNGTGFNDITRVETKPIITPQNGIVFLHSLLLWSGLHDPSSRLLVIKIIHYLGFLCIIFIFYKLFRKFKVSPEITLLCLGNLLLSAHFLKTAVAPINDGFYCFLTAMILYLILGDDGKNNYIKIALIAVLSIMLANYRLSGPLVVLGAALAAFFLKDLKKSFIYLVIFIVSYASVFVLLQWLRVDFSGIKSLATFIYSKESIINQILWTFVYTIPGTLLGISGREMMMTLPISLAVFYFYIVYLVLSMKKRNYSELVIILYIFLTIAFLLCTSGSASRYIIMVVPFSLLAIATYFKDSPKLRISLGAALLITLSISLFRLIFWDSIYFANNQSFAYVRENIREPYMLVSQSPRISYYLFNKRSFDTADIHHGPGTMIIFGNKEFIDANIGLLKQRAKIEHIDEVNRPIVLGHGESDIYPIVRMQVD